MPCLFVTIPDRLSALLLSVGSFPHPDCAITWTNLTNQTAAGGVYYEQYRTQEDCLLACVYLVPGCLAAECHFVGKESIQCLLLANRNGLYFRQDTPEASLHIVKSLHCNTTSGIIDKFDGEKCHMSPVVAVYDSRNKLSAR